MLGTNNNNNIVNSLDISFISANDIEAVNQRIDYIEEEKEKLNKSFNLNHITLKLIPAEFNTQLKKEEVTSKNSHEDTSKEYRCCYSEVNCTEKASKNELIEEQMTTRTFMSKQNKFGSNNSVRNFSCITEVLNFKFPNYDHKTLITKKNDDMLSLIDELNSELLGQLFSKVIFNLNYFLI